MAILFMGGEQIDFSPLGTTSIVTTGGGLYRADYARCALVVGASNTSLGNAYRAPFTAASANFWLGARVSIPNTNLAADPGRPFLGFYDGSALRLGLLMDVNRAIHIGVYDDASLFTKIASSAPSQPTGLFKLDVSITYGATSTLRVFVNQTEVISFSGTGVPRNNSASLSAFALSSASTDGTAWSEIVVAERDTRTLMLKTHAPTTTGTGSQWTGTYADIDEVGIDEADGISTSTADQVSTFGIDDLPAGNLAVRGFKVAGYAARGEVGPSKLDLAVKTNNDTAFSSDLAVDTGWTRLGWIWENNPVTNQAWTIEEINGLEIGVKSRS